MVRSQAAPKIADVADPSMFLLVARRHWLSYYVSPSLTAQNTLQPYVVNYAFLAIAVSTLLCCVTVSQPLLLGYFYGEIKQHT